MVLSDSVKYKYLYACKIFRVINTCARNSKSKRKTRNCYTKWFNKYFSGVLCAMPNLDIINIVINKESSQDCSAPWKGTIATLEPNKPLLMRGADRRSKIGTFLW